MLLGHMNLKYPSPIHFSHISQCIFLLVFCPHFTFLTCSSSFLFQFFTTSDYSFLFLLAFYLYFSVNYILFSCLPLYLLCRLKFFFLSCPKLKTPPSPPNTHMHKPQTHRELHFSFVPFGFSPIHLMSTDTDMKIAHNLDPLENLERTRENSFFPTNNHKVPELEGSLKVTESNHLKILGNLCP